MTTEQWERENQDILKTMYETGGYGVRQFRCGYCRKLLYTQTYNRKYCRYETCGHKALNLRNSIRRRRARGELTCPVVVKLLTLYGPMPGSAQTLAGKRATGSVSQKPRLNESLPSWDR